MQDLFSSHRHIVINSSQFGVGEDVGGPDGPADRGTVGEEVSGKVGAFVRGHVGAIVGSSDGSSDDSSVGI
jgi:hypothetical protein